MMHLINQLALILHISCGSLATLSAPGAMLMKKGGLWHRRFGKSYFWSMAMVTITAIWLCLFANAGIFLFMIALFSFYFIASGYRTLYLKIPTQQPAWIDWIMAIILLLTMLALLIYGAEQMKQVNYSIGIIAIIFSLGGIHRALTDIKYFRHFNPKPRAWLISHLQRMIAGYIATITAVSVVNFTFLPTAIRWLWPTVVGIIAITLWTRYYQQKS